MESTKKQRRCQAHIVSAEKSNTPLAIYAREHGIRVQSLYDEKNRLRKLGGQALSSFVQVEDVSRVSISPSLLQVRLPNGVDLAIPTQPVAVEQLLQSLARL